MPTLRILIVTFTFPPNKDGVSEAARAMAESFAAHGHSVQVAAGFTPERQSEVYGDGIVVRQFRVEGGPNLRDGIRGDVEAFRSFVRGFNGDFVICHGWHMWSSMLAEEVFPKLRAQKIMVSHGFTAHQWQPGRRFPWGVGYWLGWQPWLWSFPGRLRKYDHLVVLSPRANFDRFFDHLIAKTTLYRRVSVIPNGTDQDKFRLATTEFRDHPGLKDKLLVLNVANYSHRKNQELAVRAFARANLREAVLVFIGSEFNSYSQHAQSVTHRCGLDEGRVLFLQGVSRELTLSAFKSCDIFLLSARAETQPIVLLEAMNCAKPWISTDTGCVRDFPGGYVVRNVKQMAQRLQLLANDPGLRSSLGAQGREACLNSYTWKRVGARWEKLLAHMTGSSQQMETRRE